MNSYIIVNKLAFSEETYVALITYLKSANIWARPFPNVWLIKTTHNSAYIRDGIMSRINKGDSTLVMKVENLDWATSNISKQVTDWMKTNL